jgi:hypothetical protein
MPSPPGRQRPTFVLTIRQPWAWAIIYAGKNIENRSWKPNRPCRVLVHAGKVFEPQGLASLRQLRKLGVITVPVPRRYPSGVIIGAVDVTSWDHDDDRNDWAAPGYWHWNLANPVPASRVIAVTGAPTFFRPPLDWRRSFPSLEDTA